MFACSGSQHDREIDFYLKISRHCDADLSNEAAILVEMRRFGLPVPRVYSQGEHKGAAYLALAAMPGERLSALLSGGSSRHYRERLPELLFGMGRMLGHIHSLPLLWRPVKLRRQHGLPKLSGENPLFKELQPVLKWLEGHIPERSKSVFVHGDYHYANVLWENEEISAVLDWELCGAGWREFDLAWATILRPSQQFLKTEKEVEAFLGGYRKAAQYDAEALRWCRKLGYCHFLNNKGTWRKKEYQEAALSALERES
ncbi:MAG: hypothetical protein A2016_06160 [Elusimicrobia bacterium GWF2_62_30]|nr:MAG: hypothetical protein A2016_06160 [Elusimicrobia bacterium GWF2_62_30]